jgi:hypothetical protein
MVGIGVDGYFFPADSQLVSVRVQAASSSREGSTLHGIVNPLRRSIRRVSSLVKLV